MAHDRTRAQDRYLHERTQTFLWVEWQRRRLHQEYGPAVRTCLQAMAAYLLTLPRTTSVENQERRQRLQEITALNERLRQQPGSLHEELDLTVQQLCQPALRTLFPPLAQFAHTWVIRLPLDPAIPILPPWVAASVFPRSYDIRLTYRHVYEEVNLWPQWDRELVVEFCIRDGFSADELREQFDTILARHAHWHQPRQYRLRSDQDYYARVFLAYELQQQGRAPAAIAQHLWPDEWERASRPGPTRQALLRRVRDHCKRAYSLIYSEEK